MIQEIKQTAKRAMTLINNMLCRGILKEVTAAKTPTAKVTLLDGETYDGIEFAQDFGFISNPPADGKTETISIFFGGQRDHGTILKAFNKDKSFKNLNPDVTLEQGECAIYNKIANTYILMKADGSILIKSDTKLRVEAPLVEMTGDLTVTGDILDNDETNTDNVRGMRNIFNAHRHSGVQTGGGNTNVPTTLM